MRTMVSTVRTLGGTGLGFVALAFMACATAEEPQNGPNPPTAGQSGTGGSTGGTTGTAGTSALPTSGTTGSPMGGTGTGTAGTGTGGTTPTTGGTVGTAGTVGTGGTATGTCPPYAGTLGATAAADSTIFMSGFGTSKTGTPPWSGYGYTYKYGTATTVTPGMGTSCFTGAKMCASGSVPALDSEGAGLGWNIAQMMGATTMSKVAIAKPVVIKFAGVKAGMRVQLSASATVSYCYTLTAAEATAGTATIPLASFKTECWGALGMAYDGVVPIEAIQVAVPGAVAAAQTFDFCLLDIEPGT
jgi:hypothetical protein